jgi:hypothetical protein
MRLCRLNLISGNAQKDLAHSAVGFGIVFGEADPPFAKRAKVELVVLNALVNRCGFAA